MAVQRVEWRKLESYFSTGFRGLEEVRPLPFAVSVPQPDVQGPLRSHERLLFQPDVYSWPPALTDLSPLHPLQSLLTGMSFYCSSSYYIVQISASALSASLISPIQIVVCFSGMLSPDRMSKLDGPLEVINSTLLFYRRGDRGTAWENNLPVITQLTNGKTDSVFLILDPCSLYDIKRVNVIYYIHSPFNKNYNKYFHT